MPAALRKSTKAKSRALAELDVNIARLAENELHKKRRNTTPTPIESEPSQASEYEATSQYPENMESENDDELVQGLDAEEVQELTAPPKYVSLLEQRGLGHLKPLSEMPGPKTRVTLSRYDISAFKIMKVAADVPYDLPSQRRIITGLMEDPIAQRSISNNRPMKFSIIQDRTENHHYKEMDEMFLDVVAIVDDLSLPSDATRPIGLIELHQKLLKREQTTQASQRDFFRDVSRKSFEVCRQQATEQGCTIFDREMRDFILSTSPEEHSDAYFAHMDQATHKVLGEGPITAETLVRTPSVTEADLKSFGIYFSGEERNSGAIGYGGSGTSLSVVGL